MINPDLNTVQTLSKKYTYIPLYEKVEVHVEVATIYEHFRGPYTCLVELQTEQKQQGYSIIGLKAHKRLVSEGEKTTLYEGDSKKECNENPIDVVKRFMNYDSYVIPEIPVFTGGAIGHINYDMVRFQEDINDSLKTSLQLPLMQFAFINEVLVIDHKKACIYVIVNIEADTCNETYEIAKRRILELIDQLYLLKDVKKEISKHQRVARSNITKPQFLDMVKKAKQYIYQGDIFQVVLSQRFECRYEEDPVDAYLAMRSLGSSPYMYYLDFNEYVIAGVSPEMLLKSYKGHLETMPIAGTCKRGKNKMEDEQLEHSLLQNKKENCEHMMLVDLSRNDIGRVAKIGSVSVDHMKHIKRYSHVMHMTTSVQGELAKGKCAIDALMSLFPAGTLSGAPKISAMQIIDEVEHTRREVYGGTIALFAYSGLVESCIAIRTFIFHKQRVYMQAGAGIVKDSDPEKEYQETIQKAKVLFQAIGVEELQ